MTDQPTIDRAYDHCLRMARSHYENFPVASWLVPKLLRPHVAAIYAFARRADDYADEAEFAGQHMERLGEWSEKLENCFGTPTDPVFIALANTIRTYDIPIQLLRDLLTAFKHDVVTKRHATFDAVLWYCRHSANPVGRLILHLFDAAKEPWLSWSDAICTGLQLANFWQDVSVDIEKGRIYVPVEDMVRFDVNESDWLAQTPTPAIRAMMRFQVDRTQALFDEGKPLISAVPSRRLRLELKATWLGGTTILQKIRQNEYNVFIRPTIGVVDKLNIVCKLMSRSL